MDGYMQGEFYIIFERPEDYSDIIRGIADIAGNTEYQPEAIDRSRHANCIHVRFQNDDQALEDRLRQIEKAVQVERVPMSGIPEQDTKTERSV